MGAIPIGQFRVEHPIGKGGMGEVWSGAHRGTDLPVAIKVITGAWARDPRIRAAFRNEVQAVAGLNHPGIVMVFDYGEISDEADALSGGRLHAGSPYLVMESLTGGSLSRTNRPGDWPSLQRILLDLLDALAHAHARDVIHRDLKLNNVLMGSRRDARPGLKIIDFGLASTQHRDGGAETGLAAGTPAFEAPEKILGRHRDQGPWTDLYSLGCVAYALAAGHAPFEGTDKAQIMRCQLWVPTPPLHNLYPVPVGFEGWLRRLMAKHPGDRFRRAADAAYALQALSDARLRQPRRRERPVLESPIGPLRVAPTTDVTRPIEELDRERAIANEREAQADFASAVLDGEEAASVRVPPMPTSWRMSGPEQALHSMELVGAGLGLYGVRSVPLVDRSAERDRLWRALREVRRGGRAQLFLLHGEAGIGKSRLVEWLVQRSHEAGASNVLRATHGTLGGPADGLSRMVARHLGCVGMGRGEILKRTERQLREAAVNDDYEWNALTELVSPATPAHHEAGARVIRFRNPTQRYVPIRRLIERLAEERPVIAWLEDVQWGSNAIGFAQHLLAAQSRSPSAVLILLTARDDLLETRPVESGMLSDLMEMDGAQRLPIGPLGAVDRAVLVERLLGLEGELAAQVEERSGGNPMFTIQLVGDWVRRGVLEVGEHGFVLKRGEEAVIPDDIHGLWVARVDRALEDPGVRVSAKRSQRARMMLELAAVLGREVHEREWASVCRHAGLAADPELLERLLRHQLVAASESGWRPIHGMLSESLQRAAMEAGRLEQYHHACAQMLAELYDLNHGDVPERLGSHLLNAGEHDRAIDPLLEGARRREHTSEFRTARAILQAREEALERADAPESDPRWGQGWILLADTYSLQGKFDEAADVAEQALEHAIRHGWDETHAEGLRALGYVAHERGDFDRAVDLYEEALAVNERRGDALGVANCLAGLGRVARFRGDLKRAAELLEGALTAFEGLQDLRGTSMCLRNLGVIAQHSGDTTRAAALYRQALTLYEERGNQYGVAICLNDLAEVKRVEGELARAEEGYRRGLTIFDAIGSSDGVITQMNFGLVLLVRGQYGQAREALTAAAERLEQHGRRWFLCAVHFSLLPCAAHFQDWTSWDGHFEAATALLLETAVVDVDLAWTVQLGAELAAKAGKCERARAAFEIALEQWRTLGDAGRAREVEQQLEAVA